MLRSRDRRRKCTVVVAARLLVLAGTVDAGRRSGDVRRTSDLVLSAAARRQGVPAAQRAGAGAVRHDPVLRAQRLTRSQVTPSCSLLRMYQL